MNFDNNFRTELKEFFELSGVLSSGKLTHTPFIVLNGDSVEICTSASTLCEKYPLMTPVICQWRGKWNSNYFQFTVADVKYAMIGR
jgi:hypothetical protein